MPPVALRELRPVGVAILIVVLALMSATVHNTFGWVGHVSWSELGHFNVAKFEKQFRAALPVGTPKSVVEAYLNREQIPYVYDVAPPAQFLARKPYFPGQLRIDVSLDKEMKVREVRLYDWYK